MLTILYGPSGSGKSTVWKEFAKRTQKPFLDTDTEFEKFYETTISSFVAHNGIEVFRFFESSVLSEVITRHTDAVISLGWGTLLDPNNTKLINRFQWRIVTLIWDREELFRRIRRDTHNTRPLAQSQENFFNLLNSRMPHYQSFVPRISVDQKTPEQVVDDIIGIYS
jgi:shikimate kinase